MEAAEMLQAIAEHVTRLATVALQRLGRRSPSCDRRRSPILPPEATAEAHQV
jgi:hypothetical protein